MKVRLYVEEVGGEVLGEKTTFLFTRQKELSFDNNGVHVPRGHGNGLDDGRCPNVADQNGARVLLRRTAAWSWGRAVRCVIYS